MESIGLILVPYSEKLSSIAVTVTSLQFFSGLFLLNDIRKIGNTNKVPVEPFVGGIVLSLLGLQYGVILKDEGMTDVNLFGFGLNIIYLTCYYYYTKTEFKKNVWKKIGIASLFTIICLSWAAFESKDKIEFRFGILLTVILVYLVGSPLLGLAEIMRQKSVETLPFPLILSGCVVSLAWLLYGLSIFNTVLVAQNAFLLILGLIQLSLFAIYPSKKTNIKKKKEN